MKTLFEAMRDFNARNASENTIQDMFAEIAVSALSGGYFLANNTKIYPVDIEFYLSSINQIFYTCERYAEADMASQVRIASQPP